MEHDIKDTPSGIYWAQHHSLLDERYYLMGGYDDYTLTSYSLTTSSSSQSSAAFVLQNWIFV